MNFNMKIPGLKGVKIERIDGKVALYLSLPVKPHKCLYCHQYTKKIQDYRVRKIHHSKLFECLTVLYYRRRCYACDCGKSFLEDASFVDGYQHYSKEWNQIAQISSFKTKIFKDAADSLGTSSATILRRFKKVAKGHLTMNKQLPKRIAIDEYKGDTDAGKFQLVISNADTHEPIDILPNRRKDTIKEYLYKFVSQVELVVMDMNPSFKAAVNQTLRRPVIVVYCFHFCRYIYWAVDEVRRKVQKDWHAYDRKKCKRMRFVSYKRRLMNLKKLIVNGLIGQKHQTI